MLSIHNQIKQQILSKRKGRLFFAKKFMQYGTGGTVRRVLSRLCEDGLIIRLSAGVYLYPKVDKYIGILYPSIEDIAKAIAEQEKARVVPTGVYAMNALGLSTQVPMKVVFLTDGTPRTINIEGKPSILFKKTIPKYLSFKGRITTLIVFALKEIGKDNVTDTHLQKIKEALTHEFHDNIMHDVTLAPEWIADIILKLISDE
jgi:hypothetical protein